MASHHPLCAKCHMQRPNHDLSSACVMSLSCWRLQVSSPPVCTLGFPLLPQSVVLFPLVGEHFISARLHLGPTSIGKHFMSPPKALLLPDITLNCTLCLLQQKEQKKSRSLDLRKIENEQSRQQLGICLAECRWRSGKHRDS